MAVYRSYSYYMPSTINKLKINLIGGPQALLRKIYEFLKVINNNNNYKNLNVPITFIQNLKFD